MIFEFIEHQTKIRFTSVMRPILKHKRKKMKNKKNGKFLHEEKKFCYTKKAVQIGVNEWTRIISLIFKIHVGFSKDTSASLNKC